MTFGQTAFDLRCEWGEAGVRSLGSACDVVIVVDVLSFSTCVDVAVARGGEILLYPWKGPEPERFAEQNGAILARARGEGGYSLSPASLLEVEPGTRIVLQSLNGAMVSLASPARAALAGSLRNGAAVARAAAEWGQRIAVIPAGERWPDGALRPCLEDWIGAGAILDRLPGRASPEARSAIAAFREHRDALDTALLECGSGRELIERGYRDDVLLAASLDVSESVPIFDGTAYRSASGSRGAG